MRTLSEAYQDHPLHLNHIIPLDFASLGKTNVPESHVWPQSSIDFSFEVRNSCRKLSIPSVDLMDPNAPKLIGNACERWGVFHLTNHGIPLALIEETEFEARRLFALPIRQKLKALRSPNGATGYGIARISPFFSKYMWHEGFTIMGSPINHARELWPCNYKRFCDVMEEYQRKMKILVEKILNSIFKFLEISDTDQTIKGLYSGSGKSENNIKCSTALQLNCYPPCPDPDRAMGLAPHTDTFLLTVLHQTHTNGNGLQIFKNDVGWVPVSPVTGALVVNVGDLFHILSNARFTNVLHRAVVNQTCQRLSLAYFYGPPVDFCVLPHCKSVNDDDDGDDSYQTPWYRSVIVKDYVGMKAKNLHNALSLIKI